MQSIVCPHCGAANVAGSAFCESCGKALPAATPTTPRVVTGKEFATTGAGVKLQADELKKTASKAANALLTVAILQLVFGGILVAVLYGASRVAGRMPPAVIMVFVIVFGVAVIFFGLYFWARVNPLPAAIVGLVIYVTLWVLDIVMSAAAIANAPPGSRQPGAGAGPFNGIIIRIIIIAILVRAIQAGSRHRKLLQQQAFPVA